MEGVIGLGANLGDARATLAAAVRELDTAFAVLAVSALYATAPVGPPQPAYLNAAVRLSFETPPRVLLGTLLALEARFGRVRRERHGPRTLDLDVLWIPDVTLDEPGLTVPHPRLHERRFALVPLLDVAPDARDPRSGRPLAEALAALPDEGIEKVSEPDWAPKPRRSSGAD